MFRDTIPGLDRVFHSDIEPPKVTLITGPPGSMKTSFCYSLMTRYVEQTGKFGLYTTLEETVDSHLANMESLGIDLSLNMQISDITDLREIDQIVEDEEETDYIDFLETMLRHFKKEKGDDFKVFALDSLGALYSLMESEENIRKKMFYFFKLLRDLDLYSFVVMERSLSGEANLLGNEGFLVDGLIMLGMDRNRGKLTRYLQVEKMRACKHSMEKHSIEVGDNGIKVLGPIFE
ncbi:MAG: ATPase domain-containing protein [Candidatus Saliniplasma sp.]